MSSAYILQHDDLYPAGRVVSVFRDFGIPCQLRRLHAGDAVPADLDEVRLLVLLGGALRTMQLDAAHPDHKPFLAQELAVVRRMVDDDRTTIGFGFGAELLSVAGGGKVTENRKPAPPAPPGSPPAPPGELLPEYGWVQMTFPFPGGTEPAMFGMVDNAPFFAWHADTFSPPTLPPPPVMPPPPARPPTGNVVMAGTRACRTQAYRFRNRVFGFQFHAELEQADIERIIDTRAAEAGLSAEQVATMKADTAKHYTRYDRLSTKLLTNLVQFLKAY